MRNAETILAELKATYIKSFDSKVDELEQLILGLEENKDFANTFESLFRHIHNIKGTAGTFGFSILANICHQMEDFLSIRVTSTKHQKKRTVDVLFQYLDLLAETAVACENEQVDQELVEQILDKINKSTQQFTNKCLCVGFNHSTLHQIIKEITDGQNIQTVFVENAIMALERLLYEHFDILITQRENIDLKGESLIAAIRFNKAKNANIKSILVTSNTALSLPGSIPDYILQKNQSFATTLQDTLEEIKKA